MTDSGLNQTPPSEDRTNPLANLLDRPAVQRTLIGVVGLYLFLVCAAYFSRDIATSDVSVAVYGPEIVAPDTTFPLRILSYDHQAGARIHVDVQDVAIAKDDGPQLSFDSGPASKPSFIHVQGPPDTGSSQTLTITVVDAQQTERVIDVPIQLGSMSLAQEPKGYALPNEVPSGEALLIEVLPTGRGVSIQLPSSLWIRVTNVDGTPASNTKLQWSLAHGSPSEGIVKTNAAGLATIQFTLRALSTKLRIDATQQGQKGQTETRLHGQGRACILRTTRVLQAAQEPPIEVEVIRSDEDDTIFCDLYRGEHWLRTWQLAPGIEGPDGRVLVTVPMDEVGTYRFQCYGHFATPGDGYEALWLLRSAQDRKDTLQTRRKERVANADSRDAAYHDAVPDQLEALNTLIRAELQTNVPFITAPSLRANTRATDSQNADLKNTQARLQFFLWIGASFGLVILWALYVAIQSSIQNRVRLAEAIADLGELAVPLPPPTTLVRVRNALVMMLIASPIVLVVAYMLFLFQYL